MRTMPFGKHRGEYLEDIPTDYLRWCVEKLDNLSAGLRQDIEAELDDRGASYHSRETWNPGPGRYTAPPPPPGGWRTPPPSPPPPPPPPPPPKTPVNWDVISEIVETGFRACARKHHPDVGGDAELMKAVNVGATWLRQQIALHQPKGATA